MASPREPLVDGSAPSPSVAYMASGALTMASSPETRSARFTHAPVPDTNPPFGALTTEVMPPARATGIATELGS